MSAMSSAEAELCAMVAVSAEALAIVAYGLDLGAAMAVDIYTGSSATLGSARGLESGRSGTYEPKAYGFKRHA